MSAEKIEKPMPNFWMCYAALTGALAWHIWPGAGAYFAWYLLAGLLSIAAFGGLLKAVFSLRLDHTRRLKRFGARHASGVLGAARYAKLSELINADLTDPSGVMLLGLHGNTPVWLRRGTHLAVQSPPGGGKTSALVAGAIFHAALSGRSVVVTDPKPELVYLWAERLKKMGFRVVTNNPALIGSLPHNGDSNPFEPLITIMDDEGRHGEAFVFAETMARVLIKEVKDDKNSFFKENDRAFFIIAAVSLAVFFPERCYPSQIWRTLTDPRDLKNLLYEASRSDVLEGDLAAMARALLAKERDNPEHFESGRTGAAQALSVFKPSSLLGTVGARHDFDPRELRNEAEPPVVLFDIMPSDKIEVFGAVNALQQTARLKALKQHREGREVLLLCDEATNLPVPTIVSDIELMRSFGVIIALFYQTYSSVERVYGKAQAASIRASSVEMYFGVGDFATADEISRRIGDTTVKTNSYGFNEDGKPTQNIGESVKRLLPPDEILSMSKGKALALVPGLRPAKVKMTPWFEVEPYKHLAGDNPHERHGVSKRTLLSLQYGRDVTEIGPPGIPGLDKMLRSALEAERQSARPAPPSFFQVRSFAWMPVIASVAAFIYAQGTPHVLFEYETRANPKSVHACVYVGLSGIRALSVQGKCPALKLVRHQREALS